MLKCAPNLLRESTMKFIRWVLGRIILLLDFIFSPKKMKRDGKEQQEIDQLTKHLALYQFKACPFCVKVRRAIKRNGLNIETRDAQHNSTHRSELESEGGRIKVPCLRIEHDSQVTWLYESSDIIAYLESEVAGKRQLSAASA